MIGVHEDREGKDYLRPGYRRGHIVRLGELWGVVTDGRPGNRYHPSPTIEWLIDGEWCAPAEVVGENRSNISAPYVHSYEGIPDEVLARATAYLLEGRDS